MKRTLTDADANSETATLAAKYGKLLDDRDNVEWPKLFDSDWRDTVLEGQDSFLLAGQVISAIEDFVAEFGRPPKPSNARHWRSPPYVDKARRLQQAVKCMGGGATSAAIRDVRLLWLEFAADAQSAGISAPDPIDVLIETEEASRRGKLSGATRRAQSDETLKSAAAVLREMRKRNPIKRYTLADIEAALKKRLPKRLTMTGIETRMREKAVHGSAAPQARGGCASL